MSDIGEPEGMELAVAVMIARGGVPIATHETCMVFTLNGRSAAVTRDGIVTHHYQPENRPDLNIAQAWELVEELLRFNAILPPLEANDE